MSCLFCFLLTYVAVLDRLAGPCHFHFDYLCVTKFTVCVNMLICVHFTHKTVSMDDLE